MLIKATRYLSTVVLIGALWGGCGGQGSNADAPDAGAIGNDGGTQIPDSGSGSPDAAAPDGATTSGACDATGAGLTCLMELYDATKSGCDPDDLTALRTSLDARRGRFPVWHQGRALFLSDGRAASFAGTFNDWIDGALVSERLCSTDLYIADASIASGFHAYKIVVDGTWSLDPTSWAFAYDEFTGNPDGKNSVLNTYDSGRGHLVQPGDELCSTELGNCRRLTTYLPPGYDAPANSARTYPVVFMHDGQNIYDDKDCCFGHTGWEVNVTMDVEIGAGRVAPALIVGFDHGGASRIDEYGKAASQGGSRETFMEFQVNTVQPAAAAYWRLDPSRYYVAGSSLGGLISFYLAFAYPQAYAGAASLSGSFWYGADTQTAMSDTVDATGAVSVALYLDHGGTAADGGDNYPDNIAMRDLLAQKGWQRSDAPGCILAADRLCYHHAVGATHDELAWRDRANLFLRYFLAP